MTSARLLRSKCLSFGRLLLLALAGCYLLMVFLMPKSWAETGREANLAFFVQVSEENVELVPRLIRVLHHSGNVYAVHFDKKIPAHRVAPVVSTLKAEYENVHIMERELITYKGVTMLLNTIAAIDFLLTKDTSWDYFINLSGSDYPLVAPRNMRQLLGRNKIIDRSLNFVQLSSSKAFWNQMKRNRFSNIYYDTALSFRETKDPQLVPTWNSNPLTDDLGLEFVQGEAWVMLHRSACDFTIHSSYARRLLLLLSTSQDPEEHYFPMLLWNHPQFNTTMARHALRGVFWVLGGKKSGQHPYTIDVKNEQGKWVFENTINDSSAFFIRKMSIPDGPFMDFIDRTKSGVHPQPNHKKVWRALHQIREKLDCITDIDARRKEGLIMSCFGPPKLKLGE